MRSTIHMARNRIHPTKLIGLLLALLLASTWRATAHAADNAKAPSDPAEVEAFFDGLLAGQLEAHEIAGAAVAVVRDGRILLSKGYGWSNVARRERVKAKETLFRIGSVTKLFVWTAVMQLVERGELDLDKDVNTYLETFRIPDTYAEPITIRHLMSHSAGFEDRIIGLFARTPNELRPLDQVLSDPIPRRIRPPGTLTAYSNYGVALAAHVVQRVAGLPWDDYVQQHILDPLEMRSTTMRQPVPGKLLPGVSKGYAYVGGRYRSRPFELVALAPAGAGSATSSDMARFMIALLDDTSKGAGILQPDTLCRMREPLFSNDPRVGSMLHGLYEMRRTPVRAIGHGGDTFVFHSLLMLIPESRVGLFVSYNSEHGAEARKALVKAFFERYFPPFSPPLSAVPEGAQERVDEVVGTYLSTRRPTSSPLKIAAVFQAIRVDAASGGRITVQGPFPGPLWMVEQEPYLFRETLGDRTLLFRKDDKGRVSHAFFDHTPMVAFIRGGATETRGVQAAIVLSSISIFGYSILIFAIGWWRQKRKYEQRDLSRSIANACTPTFGLVLIFMIYQLAMALRDQDELAFGIPIMLRIALWTPVIAIPFWVASFGLTAVAWGRRAWSLPVRLHHTLVVVTGGVFIAWLAYWNLLGT
jgi:CubicO group peptidase (beta-lactamase class C family)